MTATKKISKPRGFAAMSVEARKAISSKGGKAASAKGVNHRYKAGSELAKAAGRKGGLATQKRRASVKKSPAPMADDILTGPSADEDPDNLGSGGCGAGCGGS